MVVVASGFATDIAALISIARQMLCASVSSERIQQHKSGNLGTPHKIVFECQ
jgi:hypothetical protein